MVAYTQLNEKIERFNKYLCDLMWASCVFCVLVPLPLSAIRYYVYRMEEESFFLYSPAWFVFNIDNIWNDRVFWFFYFIRYPFDWRNPPGFIIANLSQDVGAISFGCLFTQFYNLFFGSCYIFTAMFADITEDAIKFNVAAQTSKGNRSELMERFCGLIQLYSDANQWVFYYSFILTEVIVTNVILKISSSTIITAPVSGKLCVEKIKNK